MLYRDNEILIFDEPTAVLTPQEIEELMSIMKGLAAEGKSILFISHNLNVVRKLCTRVAVMERGLIVEEGETQQVFHHPEAPYTQRLIAAIPTRRKIDG
jgi:ABC-type dipeptide/oligopeptide/nickel transport system ATPase component